ncbi:MAG: hypothetical protein WC455_27235 [Dehalococcoidia bacterium]|jgi:hypothetical protein
MAIMNPVMLTLSIQPEQGVDLSTGNANVTGRLNGGASWGVNITSVQNFAGTIAFDITGVPAGCTYSFNPPTVAVDPNVAQGTILIVTIPGNAALLGVHTITVTPREVEPE